MTVKASVESYRPPVSAPASLPERHVVRKVTPTEVPSLSRAMARAFYDDPAASHCLVDEPRRLRRLERGFELFLNQVYLRHDECYTTEGLLAGGALWLPPRRWKLDGFEQLRLVARMARVHGRALPRILQVLGFLEARHPHEPHYYLAFIGVEPAQQGRGMGSALLRPVLERCDREQMPAYLEASSERNRALYERHGFEVVEEVRLPASGPPIWPMWREARR